MAKETFKERPRGHLLSNNTGRGSLGADHQVLDGHPKETVSYFIVQREPEPQSTEKLSQVLQ